MYFSESMIGWQLVYEDGAYCLYWYCVLMNLFESFIDYQRGNAPNCTKMHGEYNVKFSRYIIWQEKWRDFQRLSESFTSLKQHSGRRGDSYLFTPSVHREHDLFLQCQIERWSVILPSSFLRPSTAMPVRLSAIQERQRKLAIITWKFRGNYRRKSPKFLGCA
jgi:hypothetical protein